MRRELILLSMVWLLLLACGSDSVQPPANAEIRLSLTMSANSARPGEEVEITSEVSNVGRVPVFHYDGCSFSGGMSIAYFYPDGRVFDRPVRPMCPDNCCATLSPGNKRFGHDRFDGMEYGQGGGPRFAPPGDYIVEVKFEASDPEGKLVSLEQRSVIHWDVP